MREWLVDLVGTEWADKALYLVVAAIVLLLLFSVIWVARKALGGSIGPRSKGRGPRLAVMDVTAIDPKRKLVLIRRDEVEHLLLVGGQNDVVVEAGILRIPASARAPRNDAALRPEPDMEDALRQPVARPMAPKAVPTPPRTRQTAEAGDRQGLPSQGQESRVASPLTRPVPLPAPAAVERPAAAAAKPQPVAGRPADAAQAASAVRPVPQAPEPARPDEGSGSAPEPAASPQRPEAVLPDAGPSAAPDVRIEPPLLPGSTAPSAPPVSVDQDLRPSSDAKVVDPQGIDARQDAPAPVATPQPAPLPRRQTISVTAPAERAQPRPMPRVAIGGSAEPARRALPLPPPPPFPPAPQVLPMASRSMATPTYPARPDVAVAEDQAASAPAVTGGEAQSRAAAPSFPAPDDDAAAAAPREVQAPRSAGPASEASGGTAGLISPIIAAAQRQQELIRARTSPVPARTVPPLLDSGGNPLPPSDPGSRDGEEETAEKRPLSVRSFATSIQTRKPSFEPTAPAPLPAPPPPTDSEPGVSAPASGDGPATGGGVEDLRSAELDSDRAGVNLSSIAGPETAKAPEPVPLPDRQPVPAVKADAKEPWALTLEEEMDRLLGDFDFETSGSKKNG